jgi:tRNA pseudouridine13 synthase
VTEAQAAASPRIRERLEDFVVEELPLYPVLGHGDHVFCEVEKRDRTTEEIARALARVAGVRPGDIGYAGRKDRRAVARQWFSVPGVAPESLAGVALDGGQILQARRHPHKLRVGQLRGNRFSVRVIGVSDALRAGLAERLSRLGDVGMPNPFGSQRYGRDGRNAERGREILLGARPPRDRRHARFLLSALQAAVFDDVLAERRAPLDQVEPGDVAQVCASGGLFVVESVLREGPRAQRFEISATGPIFGTRMMAPRDAPAQRERAVLVRWGLDPAAVTPGRGHPRLRGTRRPFRVRPTEISFQCEDDAVRFQFALPSGSYATVFLEAALGVPLAEPLAASDPRRCAPLRDGAHASALP